MGYTLFRDSQAFSSALAALGMLQPLGLLVSKLHRSLGHGIYIWDVCVFNSIFMASDDNTVLQNVRHI